MGMGVRVSDGEGVRERVMGMGVRVGDGEGVRESDGEGGERE